MEVFDWYWDVDGSNIPGTNITKIKERSLLANLFFNNKPVLNTVYQHGR